MMNYTAMGHMEEFLSNYSLEDVLYLMRQACEHRIKMANRHGDVSERHRWSQKLEIIRHFENSGAPY